MSNKKLTQAQLKQIIREELMAISEVSTGADGSFSMGNTPKKAKAFDGPGISDADRSARKATKVHDMPRFGEPDKVAAAKKTKSGGAGVYFGDTLNKTLTPAALDKKAGIRGTIGAGVGGKKRTSTLAGRAAAGTTGGGDIPAVGGGAHPSKSGMKYLQNLAKGDSERPLRNNPKTDSDIADKDAIDSLEMGHSTRQVGKAAAGPAGGGDTQSPEGGAFPSKAGMKYLQNLDEDVSNKKLTQAQLKQIIREELMAINEVGTISSQDQAFDKKRTSTLAGRTAASATGGGDIPAVGGGAHPSKSGMKYLQNLQKPGDPGTNRWGSKAIDKMPGYEETDTGVANADALDSVLGAHDKKETAKTIKQVNKAAAAPAGGGDTQSPEGGAFPSKAGMKYLQNLEEDESKEKKSDEEGEPMPKTVRRHGKSKYLPKEKAAPVPNPEPRKPEEAEAKPMREPEGAGKKREGSWIDQAKARQKKNESKKKLTQAQLRQIIKEETKNLRKEGMFDWFGGGKEEEAAPEPEQETPFEMPSLTSRGQEMVDGIIQAGTSPSEAYARYQGFLDGLYYAGSKGDEDGMGWIGEQLKEKHQWNIIEKDYQKGYQYDLGVETPEKNAWKNGNEYVREDVANSRGIRYRQTTQMPKIDQPQFDWELNRPGDPHRTMQEQQRKSEEWSSYEGNQKLFENWRKFTSTTKK